jgi:hypothetical protein
MSEVTPQQAMHRLDALASHVWMVRTFVKHSEEAEEDDELMEIVRGLYDFCLALGPAWTAGDADEYFHVARKKFGRLREAAGQFAELQPQVSDHTNFKMAVRSLSAAVEQIGEVLSTVSDGRPNEAG